MTNSPPSYTTSWDTTQRQHLVTPVNLTNPVRDYTADLHRAANHGRRRWMRPGLALAVAV